MAEGVKGIDYKQPDACVELKTQYEKCFNVWYKTQFLTGKTGKDGIAGCQPEWKLYNECVTKKLEAWDMTEHAKPRGVEDNPTTTSSSSSSSTK